MTANSTETSWRPWRTSRRSGAAAGEALARAGIGEQRQPARKLLQDPDAMVRLRVGLALADGKEKEAIPVLIALLTECPAEHAWQVEDAMCRLAGEQMPNVPLGTDAAARKKCRDAWADWWTKHAATADLARLTDARKLLGYTLSVEINPTNGQGQVADAAPTARYAGKSTACATRSMPRWSVATAC